jgi:hypothetical protein
VPGFVFIKQSFAVVNLMREKGKMAGHNHCKIAHINPTF